MNVERKTDPDGFKLSTWTSRSRLAVAVTWVFIFGMPMMASVCLAEHYDVYLLAGQSNMDGRGAVSDLDEKSRKPFGNAIIFYRNMPTATKGWQALGPGFSIPPKYKGGLPSPTFGPELGFAKTMLGADPKSKLALIKGSKGGSSLRVDWKPGESGKPDSQGTRYRDFVETIQIATNKLSQRGDTYTIQGMLWHQGESDSKSAAKTYQKRLEKLIARVREDVDVLDLPVIVGEVYDNGKRDKVRAAIGTVGKSGPGIGLVLSNGLTTWDNGTHFDAASQLELGKRYAEATLTAQAKLDTPAIVSATAEPKSDSTNSNPKPAIDANQDLGNQGAASQEDTDLGKSNK